MHGRRRYHKDVTAAVVSVMSKAVEPNNLRKRKQAGRSGHSWLEETRKNERPDETECSWAAYDKRNQTHAVEIACRSGAAEQTEQSFDHDRRCRQARARESRCSISTAATAAGAAGAAGAAEAAPEGSCRSDGLAGDASSQVMQSWPAAGTGTHAIAPTAAAEAEATNDTAGPEAGRNSTLPSSISRERVRFCKWLTAIRCQLALACLSGSSPGQGSFSGGYSEAESSGIKPLPNESQTPLALSTPTRLDGWKAGACHACIG
ncbi:hypothetical protein L1887_62387 [Cichorium endivia]|nr:hypothetical protein L1887_62387 [Cichorium endivia]